jgi:beta-N-acetylhexosaminidase
MTESELSRAVSATLMPGFDGPVLPIWVAAELDAGLGSVCLFDTNIASPDQLRGLTSAIHDLRPEALVATDEEGGDVTRLHHRVGSPHATAAFLGRQDNADATEATGYSIGAELRDAGIDLNLAPDADVNSDPRNPVIGVRSFGANPQLVARHVAAYVRGVQRAGVAACAKHFPGHGDTATDSHAELPVVGVDRRMLDDRELVPFAAAVDAGTLAVMTSHILVPAIDPHLPATLSPAVLGLLRHDLGFTGAIVSDALDMAGASRGRGIPEAAVLALAAGVDLMCIGSGNTGEQMVAIRAHVVDAVRSGRLAETRVFEAAGRVAHLASGVGRLRARPTLPTAPPVLDDAVFWRRDPLPSVTAPLIVKLDSAGNPALAQTPWGIGEHLRPELDRWLPGATCVTTGDLGELRTVLAGHTGRPLIVQGRDLGRVRFLAEAVALVRRERPDAIVVELGWPEPGQSRDVATFGAGRGVGEALIRLLGGVPRPS